MKVVIELTELSNSDLTQIAPVVSDKYLDGIIFEILERDLDEIIESTIITLLRNSKDHMTFNLGKAIILKLMTSGSELLNNSEFKNEFLDCYDDDRNELDAMIAFILDHINMMESSLSIFNFMTTHDYLMLSSDYDEIISDIIIRLYMDESMDDPNLKSTIKKLYSKFMEDKIAKVHSYDIPSECKVTINNIKYSILKKSKILGDKDLTKLAVSVYDNLDELMDDLQVIDTELKIEKICPVCEDEVVEELMGTESNHNTGEIEIDKAIEKMKYGKKLFVKKR